jgi:hypothetical protein
MAYRCATILLGAALLMGFTPRATFADASKLSDQLLSNEGRQTITRVDSATQLLRAVLAANGVPAPEWERCESRFRKLVHRLRARRTVAGNERQKAQAIHEFMHENVLRGGYRAAGSDLAVMLAGGPFNCASASALFLALAGEFGLEAQAVSSPGHLWCRVTTSDGPLDVETTYRAWFELIDRDPFCLPDQPRRILKEHHDRQAHARLLDRNALIAVFYYNRGVRLLKNELFLAAFGANLSALSYDPHCEAAYDNLLATINDWALALAARGEHGLGRNLLATGTWLAPDYRPFQLNDRFLAAKQGRKAAVFAVED